MTAREGSELTRHRIVAAAEAVFGRHGLERTSLRAIATAAGVTAPAIYTYFATKEELYGEIIRDSLDELRARLDALAGGGSPQAELRAALFAYYAYYRDRPQQLDLGLYLFSGVGPAGITPAIDRDLNRRFVGTIDRLAAFFRAAGGGTAAACKAAATAAAVHAIGLVIMSGTRRLRLLRQDGDALMRTYISTALSTPAEESLHA